MTDDATALSERLELARDASREAGRLTLQYFSPDVPVERKSDDSPVTVADREAEQLLRRRISEAFPDDGILGEEFGERDGTSGVRWILDPIDGTKSFIAGVPIYGTLVGVEIDGQSQIGVIELPALDQRIYASKGQGAWWQVGHREPVQASVSAIDRLADGVYLTSEPSSFSERNAAAVHTALESAAWYSRSWGDCYGYFLLATGRAVAMIDPFVAIWDAAALYPVVTEAGGTITDWAGNSTYTAGELVGTNGRVLPEVLALTSPHAGR